MELAFVEDFGYLAHQHCMNEYLVELLDTTKMLDSIHAKGPLNCLVDVAENRAAWKKQ